MTDLLAKLSTRQRKIFGSLGVILICLVLLWLLIPSVTKWLANRYLADHNATLVAETINPDLFPLGLELADVSIMQQDQPTLSLGELSIGLDFWPLFKGALHVNHILVNNFDIQVTQTAEGWNVAGVPLPSGPTETAESSEAQSDSALAPSFLITDASLKDIQVRLNTERGQDILKIVNLGVEEASHHDANWNGIFNLTALVNDAEATLDGTISATSEQIDANMALSSAALSTNDIEHFLPPSRPQLSAQNVRLSGTLDALYQFNQAPLLRLTSPLLALSSDRVAFTQKHQEMGWEALHTELADATVTLDNRTDLRASADNTLSIKGLNISRDSEQLSARDLSLSSHINLEKQQSHIVLQQSKAQLQGSTLKGGLQGHQFDLNTLDIGVSDIALDFDSVNSTGTLESQLAVAGNDFNARLKQGEQASLKSVKLSTPFNLAISEQNQVVHTGKTSLMLGATHYRSDQLEAAIDSLALTLNQLALQQSDQLSIGSDALNLDIKNPTLRSNATDATLANISLKLTDSLIKQSTKELAVSGQSSLNATQLSAHLKALPKGQPNTQVAFDTLALDSQISWQQTPQQSLLQAAKSQLDLDQINVAQEKTLKASLAHLSLRNDTTQVTLPDQSATQVDTTNNTLTFAALNSELSDGSTLLNWRAFELISPTARLLKNGLSADVSRIKIEQLLASDPAQDTGLPALVGFDQLLINSTQLRPEGVHMKNVHFDTLKAGMVLSKDRKIANLTLPPTLQDNSNVQTTQANSPSKSDANKPATPLPYHVIVDQLTVSPGSSALFTDNGIQPSLTRVLDIEQLQVDNFNTRDKDQAAHIQLKARNGNYATIESDVTIRPMAPKLTLQATAKIREVELPPISPYVSSALGYTINSGHLNMDLDITSKQGELDGDSRIVLRQFDLGGKKDGNALLKVGAVPLDLAVDALKNRNNEIVLDLPMSGNIENPNFQWQSFFLLPIRQGLFKASSAYLMQTFVPYANVITLVQFAGEQALKLRVEPLQFALGEEDITAPEQEAFLDQMITLMKDRKGAQLRACGVSVVRDVDEDTPYDALTRDQRSELLELADERAETLKGYLVDKGIKSSRIFLCSPSIDDDNNALPRVTFSF